LFTAFFFASATASFGFFLASNY